MEGFHGFTGGGEGDVEGSQIEPLELSWMNVMTVSLRAHATKRAESLRSWRPTEGSSNTRKTRSCFPTILFFIFVKVRQELAG